MRLFIALSITIALTSCAPRYQSEDMSPGYGAALAHQLGTIEAKP